MEIENSTEANMAVLQLLRQQQAIDIDLQTAVYLAQNGGFLSIQVDQVALDELILELQTMNDDELRAFRRDLARQEVTNPEQYPIFASN